MKRIKIEKFEGLTPAPEAVTCPMCSAKGYAHSRKEGQEGFESYECGACSLAGDFKDYEGCCSNARKLSSLRHRIKQLEHALNVEKKNSNRRKS
jgi:hypothetical protein